MAKYWYSGLCIAKVVHSKSPVHGHDPKFCSLTDTHESLQCTIKTHLSGPPRPKFEGNMNYISQALQVHETVQQKCYCKISCGITFDYYHPGAILQWCDT